MADDGPELTVKDTFDAPWLATEEWERRRDLFDEDCQKVRGMIWRGLNDSPLSPEAVTDTLLRRDLLLYGHSYERRHPDGRRERIDPTEVIHTARKREPTEPQSR